MLCCGAYVIVCGETALYCVWGDCTTYTVVPALVYVPAQYTGTTLDARAVIDHLYDWPAYVPVVLRTPALYWNRVPIHSYPTTVKRVPVVPSDSTGTQSNSSMTALFNRLSTCYLPAMNDSEN